MMRYLLNPSLSLKWMKIRQETVVIQTSTTRSKKQQTRSKLTQLLRNSRKITLKTSSFQSLNI